MVGKLKVNNGELEILPCESANDI